PSVARYVFVNCNTKEGQNQPNAASIFRNDFVSLPSLDFQCFRNSRWTNEVWYFTSVSFFGHTQALLGYGLMNGKVLNHGAGFYDSHQKVYNIMNMYPGAERKARFFIFDDINGSYGMDYGTQFDGESSFFDYPKSAYFSRC